MEDQLSPSRSPSPSCSSLVKAEAPSIIAEVDAAAVAGENPPGVRSGSATSPAVDSPGGQAVGNPPMIGDCPAEDVSHLGMDLLTLLNDPRSKVPCTIREKVMEFYFKMQRIIMSLSAGRAAAEGKITELRRELDGVRGCCLPVPGGGDDARPAQFPDVVRRAPTPAQCGPGRSVPSSSAPAESGGHLEHALRIRLRAPSATSGRDIATRLKSTFNPAVIGVGPVTFRPTQTGLTVTSQVR